MQYRIDKRSGNQISALGLGCMRFPRNLASIDVKKSEQIVLAAINLGINFFDTAYLYPGVEAALGNIIDKNNLRNRVFISTKLPFSMCKTYDDFDKFFYKQLALLKTDYIDYYFVHAISKESQWNFLIDLGFAAWLHKKKTSGEIRQVGFSFHGSFGEFEKIIDEYDWDFCMIQYNYIDTNYQAGRAGLKLANCKGITVFVMEPLLGGQLANNLPEKAVRFLSKSDKSRTCADWALGWVLNHPEVTMLLSGMNTTDQITQNAQLAEKSLPGTWSDNELAVVKKVAEIFSESYKVPCTGCNYCMPCPANVNIPVCFAAYNSSYSMQLLKGIHLYALGTGSLSLAEPSFASNCIKCGKCVKQCPQHIDIPTELENVKLRIEPKWFKFILMIARKILR